MDGYVEGYRTLGFRQVTDVVPFLQLDYEAVCWFLLPEFTGHAISQCLMGSPAASLLSPTLMELPSQITGLQSLIWTAQ
jgi:hypothetical protein